MWKLGSSYLGNYKKNIGIGRKKYLAGLENYTRHPKPVEIKIESTQYLILKCLKYIRNRKTKYFPEMVKSNGFNIFKAYQWVDKKFKLRNNCQVISYFMSCGIPMARSILFFFYFYILLLAVKLMVKNKKKWNTSFFPLRFCSIIRYLLRKAKELSSTFQSYSSCC